MKTISNPPKKPTISKIKRNINNTALKKHFGKNQSPNIWNKDIFTGE